MESNGSRSVSADIEGGMEICGPTGRAPLGDAEAASSEAMELKTSEMNSDALPVPTGPVSDARVHQFIRRHPTQRFGEADTVQ